MRTESARLTDENVSALARDAARALSVVDTPAVASITATLRCFETAKLGDTSAMREAAKSIESTMRTIVAPQMASQIAETLKGTNALTSSLGQGIGRIAAPSFAFSKTIDGLNIAPIAEAFKAWEAPPRPLSAAIAEALRGIPNVATSNLAPTAVGAVGEAVVLAETPAASEIAHDALADLDDFSPAERRELEKDVVNAIATLGTLIAILLREGRIELASATLTLVVILVSIYWRLTGKLQE